MDKRFQTFLISYRYEGQEWGFELKARDLADAKARLAMLPHARLDGQLMFTMPAGLGPLATIAVYIRNAFRKVFAS